MLEAKEEGKVVDVVVRIGIPRTREIQISTKIETIPTTTTEDSSEVQKVVVRIRIAEDSEVHVKMNSEDRMGIRQDVTPTPEVHLVVQTTSKTTVTSREVDQTVRTTTIARIVVVHVEYKTTKRARIAPDLLLVEYKTIMTSKTARVHLEVLHAHHHGPHPLVHVESKTPQIIEIVVRLFHEEYKTIKGRQIGRGLNRIVLRTIEIGLLHENSDGRRLVHVEYKTRQIIGIVVHVEYKTGKATQTKIEDFNDRRLVHVDYTPLDLLHVDYKPGTRAPEVRHVWRRTNVATRTSNRRSEFQTG